MAPRGPRRRPRTAPDPSRSITSITKPLGISPGALCNHIPHLREPRSAAVPADSKRHRSRPTPARSTTLPILRTPAGVEEDITLALSYGKDETPPLDAIEPLAAALTIQLTSLRTARHDLTVPPHLKTPLIPVALTLGHDEIQHEQCSIPVDQPDGRGRTFPMDRSIGHRARPTLHRRPGRHARAYGSHRGRHHAKRQLAAG